MQRRMIEIGQTEPPRNGDRIGFVDAKAERIGEGRRAPRRKPGSASARGAAAGAFSDARVRRAGRIFARQVERCTIGGARRRSGAKRKRDAEAIPTVDGRDREGQERGFLKRELVRAAPHRPVGGAAGRKIGQGLRPGRSAARSRSEKTPASRQTARRSIFSGATPSLRKTFRWNDTQKAQPLICDARNLTSSVRLFSSPNSSTVLLSAARAP